MYSWHTQNTWNTYTHKWLHSPQRWGALYLKLEDTDKLHKALSWEIKSQLCLQWLRWFLRKMRKRIKIFIPHLHPCRTGWDIKSLSCFPHSLTLFSILPLWVQPKGKAISELGPGTPKEAEALSVVLLKEWCCQHLGLTVFWHNVNKGDMNSSVNVPRIII